MEVLTAAWCAAGAPQPPTTPTTPPAGAGPRRRSSRPASEDCARCGSPGPLVAVREVVSKSFTGYDGWRDPAGSGLCAACSWGYRTRSLRTTAHLVTRTPTLRPLARAELAEQLTSPVSAGEALVVPLRPGRKHLALDARWGVITVDDTHLSWSTADVDRFTTARQLRRLGFGPRSLGSPAPPWPTLRTLSRHQQVEVLALWPLLSPWRARRPWLELAGHALTPDRSPGAAA